MKTDLFNCLPPEIVTNILLRLPVDAIASSKCVSKPWRDFLETDYFLNLHLSKSAPFLAVMTLMDQGSSCFEALEFEDGVESTDLRYSQVTMFDFPEMTTILGAANGLLLLSNVISDNDIFYICNPVTRRYIEIPGPERASSCRLSPPFGGGACGFGVSRMSGQFKVVWISPKRIFASESECRVCTLGTGSWRRVEAARASLMLKSHDCVLGAYLEGNLHWTVTESLNEDKPLITCFDLETECFSSFGAPASRGGLSVVRDCLCFCELKDGIVVWVMKEYGVDKSWSKDFAIGQCAVNSRHGYKGAFPIEVFENGDVLLMLLEDKCVRYYFKKTKTFQDYGICDDKECGSAFISSMLFTPSFQTLKGLGMENVILY